MSSVESGLKIGWIGAGRMGFPMAARLAKAGNNVAVYNRTRAKAEPLTEYGASIVDTPAELADCDVIFTMVSTSKDLAQVLAGENGVFSGISGNAPKCFVDCSSVSVEASAEMREAAKKIGSDFIAAPVSGNGKVVKAGKLTIVASGPEAAFKLVEPFLQAVGVGVTYVGEGELARSVKICHNVLLAVVTQNLAEITILAEKAGVPRHAFLDFINNSVMGSVFTRYKTPSWVNLDFTTTFTPELMRKDVDLGLAMGKELEVPMPVTSITRDVIQSSMGHGNKGDIDFGIVFKYMAECSGLDLVSEDVEVLSGLETD
ncbi:NAD(P)-dependent oxidoreductase [Emcibacter sp.]|uniref:NAD(P)-dependent oxidoreductase n=1 Tax=Emcibacter sp. TaxID=1979954 RepID=UPI003A8E657E